MAAVAPEKWFDSGVMAIFLLLLSSLTLHGLGQLAGLASSPYVRQNVPWAEGVAKTLIPMKNVTDFNLTHILLMAIVIAVLSIRDNNSKQASKSSTASRKRTQKKDEED